MSKLRRASRTRHAQKREAERKLAAEQRERERRSRAEGIDYGLREARARLRRYIEPWERRDRLTRHDDAWPLQSLPVAFVVNPHPNADALEIRVRSFLPPEDRLASSVVDWHTLRQHPDILLHVVRDLLHKLAHDIVDLEAPAVIAAIAERFKVPVRRLGQP